MNALDYQQLLRYLMNEEKKDGLSNFSTSEKTNELVAALIAAKKELGDVIAYDAKNPHYKNRFASLEKTLKSINPKFQEQGLVLTQFPAGDQLISRLEHISGQWMMSAYNITASKKDPQQMGSAITYARRYCAQAIAGICGGEDDDAESAMGRGGDEPPAGNGGNGPADNGGATAKEIAADFISKTPTDSFVESLNQNWDEMMRSTKNLNERKHLAALLNEHKKKVTGTTPTEDL